jgi:hypothetical protein
MIFFLAVETPRAQKKDHSTTDADRWTRILRIEVQGHGAAVPKDQKPFVNHGGLREHGGKRDHE